MRSQICKKNTIELCIFFHDFSENFYVNEKLFGILPMISKSGNGLLGYISFKSPKKCYINRSQLVHVSVNGILLWNVYPTLQGFVGRVYVCWLVNSLGIICFVVKGLNRAYYRHSSCHMSWRPSTDLNNRQLKTWMKWVNSMAVSFPLWAYVPWVRARCLPQIKNPLCKESIHVWKESKSLPLRYWLKLNKLIRLYLTIPLTHPPVKTNLY